MMGREIAHPLPPGKLKLANHDEEELERSSKQRATSKEQRRGKDTDDGILKVRKIARELYCEFN